VATGLRDSDRGYRDFVKRILGLQKPRVAVGVFEAAGSESAGDGVTVLDVAIWNEFGTDDGHVPARSFLRAWFDENQTEIRSVLLKRLQAVALGKLTKQQALEQFGLWAQAKIQARISKGIPPANAPSTVEKKGSSKPLIDKGQLRSSITFAIDLGTGALRVMPPKG
jgi:hypothetical protein